MFKFGKKDKGEKESPAAVAPSPTKPEVVEQKAPPAVAAAPKPEANSASATKTFVSGLMNIKILETRGLKMPPESNLVVGGSTGKDIGMLPFAVIEIDKNEVMMRAIEHNPQSGVSSWQTKANFDVSRPCDTVVTVYMPGLDRKDVLIGSVTIRASFVDQKVDEDWATIAKIGPNNESPTPTGEIRIHFCYKTSKPKKMVVEDFELLKVIGKGSFGKVMQVKKKDTGRVYAMKIIKKQHIVERDEVAHTLAERTVLTKLNHPFIVPLKYSFQSPEKLYLCLAFVNGGELFFHLQQEGRFSEDRAKFYIAELLCSLECLHSFGIIYRDLKPENILLDYTGHIALCDFGLCKLNMKEGNKTNTFCGTPEYLAPEVLIGKGYTKSVDWWTLGILLYEMIGGLPPFYDENVNIMYNKILNDKLTFHDFMSADVIDLLSKLLDRDGGVRLGAGGAQEIKAHRFFGQVDWKKLISRQYTPPFRPNVASAMDTSNFDEEFTSEAATDSLTEGSQISEAIQQQFQGFTFQQTEAIAGSISTTGNMMPPKNDAVAGSMMRQPGGMRRQ
ncbi:kinase-like domain-containing protein [Globomyces pollinis-pini]|nr:kinase-like domain-containing protein [Globomyces pollinis-pini]